MSRYGCSAEVAAVTVIPGVDMTEWFQQTLAQALVIGCIVATALFLPWLPLQVIAIVAVIYVVYSILHHPRTFYRRMFVLVTAACLLPSLLSLTLRSSARATLPEGGWVSAVLMLELDSPPVAWLLFGIAGLCLVGDLLYLTLVDRPRAEAVSPVGRSLVIYSRDRGGLDLRTSVAISGPVKGALIRGAEVRVWLRYYECQVHATQPDRYAPRLPVLAGEERQIAPGESVTLFIHANIDGGLREKWLLWRARTWIPLKFRGLRLVASPRWLEEPLPFRLDGGSGSPPE
jgi:hypothetical protein